MNWRQRLWAFQHRNSPYLFIAPFVVLFAVFMLYPLVRSVVLSLHQTSGGPGTLHYVGFGNYSFLIQDRLFWLAVLNTFGYTFLFVSIQIPAALGLAVLLNGARVRFRNVFRFAFFSPYLVGHVFVAVIFTLLLARHGPLNQVLNVGLGILRVHQAGDGALELSTIHHDGGVHREVIVFSRVIDVRVRVADVANITDLDPMTGKLVLDHVLVVLQSAHAQRFHDRVVAIAGIDDDRILPAEDQEAIDRHALHPSAATTKHEKARFELNVAKVQHLDFQRHQSGSLCHSR